MNKLTKSIIAVACLSCSAASFASDNYLSAGVTHVAKDGVKANGFGLSWASFASKDSSIGYIITSSYTKKSKSMTEDGTTVSAKGRMYDLNVGPIFRVPSVNWLRFYPIIGVTRTSGNATVTSSDSLDYDVYSGYETDFNYGAGLQFTIPSTKIFGELNIKKVTGKLDTTTTYFGMGYNF